MPYLARLRLPSSFRYFPILCIGRFRVGSENTIGTRGRHGGFRYRRQLHADHRRWTPPTLVLNDTPRYSTIEALHFWAIKPGSLIGTSSKPMVNNRIETLVACLIFGPGRHRSKRYKRTLELAKVKMERDI
jgi:hypothetical protein